MSAIEATAPQALGGKAQPLPPCTLVVFGATGDLARRKLVPAIYNLAHDGLLSPRFRLVGTSRSRLGDEEFQARAAEWIRCYSRRVPEPAIMSELLARFHFVPGYSDDQALHADLGRSLAALEDGLGPPPVRLFYLSTAPELFSPIVEGLGREGLREREGADVRVLIEKPFGRSAEEAAAFNRTLLSVFSERQVFRIDHYLGKEEVQNILALRFANPIFEPFWNAGTIASVQLTAAEDLGVGSRAGYYEESGALRDHIQNHMLQLLCMICMEPPVDLSADAVRDAKVSVLEAVEPPTAAAALRAQYGAGRIRGEDVPGYLEEQGVAVGSRTETFAALRLAVRAPRWSGVPFYLRTGKRLARKETEIAIRLRPAPHPTFLAGAEADPFVHGLVIGLRASGAVRIAIATKVPGVGMRARPVEVEIPAAGAGLVGDAYERLLLDGLEGNPTLFTRSDEIEQQWRICDPVLRRWAGDERPLPQYEAGSQGPAEAGQVLREGDAWRPV
jgi:glucose-6-phosphate 1-dehydrogenase